VAFYRDRKSFNPESFCDELDEHLPVGQIVQNQFPLHQKNFDRVFDQFVSEIADLVNQHAPLKPLSRKQQKLAKKPGSLKES